MRFIEHIRFLLCMGFILPLQSQTYVGEILYGNTYQYAKISITDSLTTFSIPYIDAEKKFSISENIKTDSNWKVIRANEIWNFTTQVSDKKIIGNLSRNGKSQDIFFFEQDKALLTNELTLYEGVFENSEGNRAIIYSRNGYLHIMSPFSERTMSLKPIEQDTFWCASGETVRFLNNDMGEKTELILTDRFHKKQSFNKLPPITIEEVWIPVEKDTLFAKLFIPSAKDKVPACLVLPGGGATGMDNYEYEARFFAANGMVSMVFDKSGNGKSKGTGNFNLQTFEEKTDQYLQLFNYLQNHSKVNKEKVGVHGPSEGGRLALMMAIDAPEIAFVNATAAPIMTMREGQLYAVDQYLRNLGVTEVDNIAVSDIWNDYYEGIITNKIDSTTINKANLFRLKYEGLLLPPSNFNVPGSPSAEDLLNNRVVEEAGNISCPVFLQYGENDARVHPEKSIQNFMKFTQKDLPVSIKIYPRGNHSMMTPEFEICHGYADDKRKWLQKIGIL